MCYCDFSDPPTFFTETTVRARKPHLCCECRDEIKPGETYRRSSGKWEGRCETFATCLACVVLWKSVLLETGCECWCFGGLREELREVEQEQEWMLMAKDGERMIHA